MADIELHSTHSTLRERIVEHVFVGEALRALWRRGITDVEVVRTEFEAHPPCDDRLEEDLCRHPDIVDDRLLAPGP